MNEKIKHKFNFYIIIVLSILFWILIFFSLGKNGLNYLTDKQPPPFKLISFNMDLAFHSVLALFYIFGFLVGILLPIKFIQKWLIKFFYCFLFLLGSGFLIWGLTNYPTNNSFFLDFRNFLLPIIFFSIFMLGLCLRGFVKILKNS